VPFTRMPLKPLLFMLSLPKQAAEKLCFVSGHDFSRAVND
jgi:hypothetical protein